MITLIGHGYVGEHIGKEMSEQNISHHWIRHTDSIPDDTSVIINAAGYTGSLMLMHVRYTSKRRLMVM